MISIMFLLGFGKQGNTVYFLMAEFFLETNVNYVDRLKNSDFLLWNLKCYMALTNEIDQIQIESAVCSISHRFLFFF